MEKIKLIRNCQDSNYPTVGILVSKDGPIGVTLELPWKDNQHDTSCIPCGTYTCKYEEGRRSQSGVLFERCFEILNVPGRAGVLIHCGNTTQDTHGCILIGRTLTIVNTEDVPGNFHISESRVGMYQLIDYLRSQDFELEIVCA